MYHVGVGGLGVDCLVERYALFESDYLLGGVSCGGRLSPSGDACWFWLVRRVVCLGWGLSVTKRVDLHEQREQAVERFGLSSDAFLVKQYRPSVTMAELSDEHMSEAIEMASLGAFESAIARVLGVPENVFMSALRKGKVGEEKRFIEFSKAFYEARKKHLKRNLRVMNEAVEEGDWKPAAWQLERSFGFAKQEVVEHDVAPEAFSLMQLAQIPVADARAIIEAEAVEVDE